MMKRGSQRLRYLRALALLADSYHLLAKVQEHTESVTEKAEAGVLREEITKAVSEAQMNDDLSGWIVLENGRMKLEVER